MILNPFFQKSLILSFPHFLASGFFFGLFDFDGEGDDGTIGGPKLDVI